MSLTTKSPRAVVREALAVADGAFPLYSHRFSPKKFTQHQLFALLVLKTHQGQDYRGIVALLEEMPAVVGELGLKAIPHYTTLQKAANRLLGDATVQQLLTTTVERFRKKAIARSSRPKKRCRRWSSPFAKMSRTAPASRFSVPAKTAWPAYGLANRARVSLSVCAAILTGSF